MALGGAPSEATDRGADEARRRRLEALSLGTATDRRTRVRAARADLLQSARRHGVRRIRLFGSLARDDETETGDVDLLVDLAPGRTLLDLIAFKQDAERIIGLPVDAATPGILKDRVRVRVLREARPLRELGAKERRRKRR